MDSNIHGRSPEKEPQKRVVINYSGTPHSKKGGSFGRNKRPQKRALPVGIVIAADVLIAAVILLFFYLGNYVWEGEVDSEPLATARIESASPSAPSLTAGPSPIVSAVEPTPTLDMTVWRNKFADKFTKGDVEQTDNSYRSANVSVTIDNVEEEGVVYFVADIYIADIKYFKTAFGKNKPGKKELIKNNLKNNNGIIGINGDDCWNNACVLIRNGVYYKKWSRTQSDALVMYNDGTMKMIPGKDVNFKDIKAQAPYQVWGFGPILLDSDGQPMTKFNSSVKRLNPRTAVGYYEPGHYCFVAVDGRRANTYSKGYTMSELAELMCKLGCKAAFNLDGGGSTQMSFLGENVNIPSVRREVDDMIYITDSED